MALERDNPAERLARIDKLMADMAPTPPQQQIPVSKHPSWSSRCPKAHRSTRETFLKLKQELEAPARVRRPTGS